MLLCSQVLSESTRAMPSMAGPEYAGERHVGSETQISLC